MGPYLHFCNVQDWGITLLAHSKAVDMHFRLLGSGFEDLDTPFLLDVSEDGDIKIPMTADGDDNFVVGIGMDFTSESVSCC